MLGWVGVGNREMISFLKCKLTVVIRTNLKFMNKKKYFCFLLCDVLH
jgi:hypothetical protein